MRRAAMFVAGLLLTAVLAAASVRPGEIDGAIAADKPYGTASLTWFFLTAYEASLWTDAPRWSMDRPFALSLTYKLSFTRDELVERTLEEMKKVSPSLTRDVLARHGAALNSVYPDVKSGDRVTALHMPGEGVRFFHNGRLTGEVDDPSFAEPFFGIWLSPRTSEPKMRAALLGLSG